MKQILMVRHGILKIVILYLRYLSRDTPYNDKLNIAAGHHRHFSYQVPY